VLPGFSSVRVFERCDDKVPIVFAISGLPSGELLGTLWGEGRYWRVLPELNCLSSGTRDCSLLDSPEIKVGLAPMSLSLYVPGGMAGGQCCFLAGMAGSILKFRGRSSRILLVSKFVLSLTHVGLVICMRLGTIRLESLLLLDLNVVILFLPGGSGGNEIFLERSDLRCWPPCMEYGRCASGTSFSEGLNKIFEFTFRFKLRGSSWESVHDFPRRQDPFVWQARQKGTDLPFFL
jgi:hypothetical protein